LNVHLPDELSADLGDAHLVDESLTSTLKEVSKIIAALRVDSIQI
jgi:hypothetical protein